MSPFTLSSIHIDHDACPPTIQTSCKQLRFTQLNRRLQRCHTQRFQIRNRFLRLLLFPLLLLQISPTAHAIPGTNYSMINGVHTNDTSRQLRYAKTIIQQTTSSTSLPSTTNPSQPKPPTSTIRNEPICFIADTDSMTYAVDSGANRVILKEFNSMTNIKITKGSIQGIGGKGVTMTGSGHHELTLQSDDGHFDTIPSLPAVCVPSSPYNLIPPQLLIKHMKSMGYIITDFSHDDTAYKFKYISPTDTTKTQRTVSIPIAPNGLFILRSKPGYRNFMSRASQYCPSFKNFAGNSHFIPSDDDDESTSTSHDCSSFPHHLREHTPLPSQSNNKTREDTPYNIENDPQTREYPPEFSSLKRRSCHHDGEPPSKTREPPSSTQFTSPPAPPTTIPELDEDLAPLKTSPLTSDFTTTAPPINILEDASLAATARKKARLFTIHEQLGHLSFSILRDMARAGLIPKDLATIDPPICPGCAYGKARRKQWRYKGARNRKHIRCATKPGEVISVDQLVSPTPGFVPIHRGNPTKKRYIGATIFVDHFSDFTYCHLMTVMDAASTVEAKLAFERLLAIHAITASHYHCDNGLFDTKLFRLNISTAHQTMSFCGVNAHHQNGKAERRIGDITTGTRTSLLHASHRWPSAINSSLWPSAMKNYINLRNNLPSTFIKGEKVGRKALPDQFISSPSPNYQASKLRQTWLLFILLVLRCTF